MKEFKCPYDEDERIDALKKMNMCSGESIERLDRIARVAQRIFALPYADFSLIDTQDQVLLSSFGYAEERISRDISMANHALCKGEIFVVSDTLRDDRFAGNPLVVSQPKIRFYAGIPVRNKNATRIGVFSVAGREPRAFSAQDQSMLRDLGEMITNELSFLEVAQFDRSTQMSVNDGFFSLAQQGLRVCERNKNPAVVVVFDVKKIQTISEVDSDFDKDRHIRVFANKLRHFFRKSDVIGRLGSEEFTALLLNTRVENLSEIIMKLQAALDSYNASNTSRVQVGFTHGFAEFDPEHPVTSNALVAMANRTLHRLAKVS